MGEIKRAEYKQWVKDKMTSVIDIWNSNKATVITVAVPVIGGIVKIVQIMGRCHNKHIERRDKDYRCYDASLGHYWELKKKLKNEDWIKINKRRQHGESLGDILKDIGALK